MSMKVETGFEMAPGSGGVIPTHRRGRARHWAVGIALLLTPFAAGQTPPPEVSAAGVVNAASYAQPVTPRSIVSIFGSNLAPVTQSAGTIPLPTEIAGTSVTWNGIKAPLFFVSPGQINLQVPTSLEAVLDPSRNTFTTVIVIVTTGAGPSASLAVPLYFSSASIFSLDGSGCGRAAALNVAADGSVSLNSPANSAAPGDVVSVYGTGFGKIGYPPPDGTPADAQNSWAGANAEVGWQGVYSLYAGPAPMLVGVDQINVLLLAVPPGDIAEGCAVPLSVGGPALTISIHSGRGQCVDPPIRTYGQVILAKTVSTGTDNDGEADSLTAVLSSAPGLQQAPPLLLDVSGLGWRNLFPTVMSRSCDVPGYTNPSAGTITVLAERTGQSVAVAPTGPPEGVTYQQPLPVGFVQAGSYTISGPGGPVSFRAGLNAPPPITVESSFPPGTAVPVDQPLTVKWSGGQPGTQVNVIVTAFQGVWNPHQIASGDGSKGSLTFPCTPADGYCYAGVTSAPHGQITVEYSSASPATVDLQGATGNVQANWMYRYVFGGLALVSGPQ